MILEFKGYLVSKAVAFELSNINKNLFYHATIPFSGKKESSYFLITVKFDNATLKEKNARRFSTKWSIDITEQ